VSGVFPNRTEFPYFKYFWKSPCTLSERIKKGWDNSGLWSVRLWQKKLSTGGTRMKSES
jgi:hypothetical protein